MKVYDLSVPIINGADWYNEALTPPVQIKDIGNMEKEGWVSHTIALAVLNGCTYIETAAHLFKEGALLEEVPPERWLRRAYIVRAAVEGQEIAAPEKPLADFRKGEDAILIHCGWDTHLDQPDFYARSPYFSRPIQEWLLDHNPAILGGDMISYDHPDDTSMPFLHAYFRGGGMILCPLKGLGEISEEIVTMCAAPMKLAGANCAPCRVLAWSPDSHGVPAE